jgi:Chitin synthase
MHSGISTTFHGMDCLLVMLMFRGDTRRIEGELKGPAHGDGDGDFDSSQIVMKRWAEFERDSRRKQIAAQQYETPQQVQMGGPRPPSSKAPSSLRGYDMGYM